MTRLSVFCASSTDGYIATLDDDLAWLDAAVGEGEDYGYDEFIATVDAVAMGRGTYDYVVRQLGDDGPSPWGERAVYVFTNRPPAPREHFTFWSCSPGEALAHWEAAGHERVYVDGGQVIGQFLAAGLIDDLTLTKAPVLLGEGRPLFPPVAARAQLRLDDVKAFPSGMLNLYYSRVRD
ncbi:MAG: dihydrofolate reductase family protein [Acidimicrobiia bacterium]